MSDLKKPRNRSIYVLIENDVDATGTLKATRYSPIRGVMETTELFEVVRLREGAGVSGEAVLRGTSVSLADKGLVSNVFDVARLHTEMADDGTER